MINGPYPLIMIVPSRSDRKTRLRLRKMNLEYKRGAPQGYSYWAHRESTKHDHR